MTSTIFQTYEGQRPRTCGVIVKDAVLSSDRIRYLSRLAFCYPLSAAAGKLVAFDGSMIRTYQIDAQQTTTVPVYCANATAAALMFADAQQATACGPDGEFYQIEGEIDKKKLAVSQSWIFESGPKVTSHKWEGIEITIVDFLNWYMLIQGPLPNRITPTIVLQEMVGTRPTAKLALINKEGLVEFYCLRSGRHGATPLTGLATIAIAAEQGVKWLSRFLKSPTITYWEASSGREIFGKLPSISNCYGSGIRINLPARGVKLYMEMKKK